MRALVVLIAFVALTSTAAADPSFAWQAPSACPSADDVRARIERRLGHPLDHDGVGIAVDVDVAPGGFVARVDARGVTAPADAAATARGDNDVRTLTSAHCDELADAVAVVVARLTTEARRVAVVERRMGPALVIDQIAPPSQPRAWGGGVRALGLSGIGRVPSIGIGGELAIFIHHRDRFAEIAGAKWMQARISVPEGNVDVGLDLLSLRVGWSPERMPIRGWLTGELGARAGDGMGPSRWTAIGAGFGVAWPMSPELRLVGTFEIDVPIERPPVLDSGAEIYRPAWLTAHTALGFEVAWL